MDRYYGHDYSTLGDRRLTTGSSRRSISRAWGASPRSSPPSRNSRSRSRSAERSARSLRTEDEEALSSLYCGRCDVELTSRENMMQHIKVSLVGINEL